MILNTERKYSPSTLDEFIFPDEESKELVMAYATGKIDKPLLIFGGSGTGKSTLQKLLPNAIEGRKASIRKIRCSDFKSQEDIHKYYGRTKFFCKDFKDEGQKYNYFIIEEFLLKTDKLNDALKIELDESIGIDLSIFSTNRIDQVDKGILSRCELLELKPCEPNTFFNHAKKIFMNEEKEIDDQYLMKCLQAVYTLNADNRKYYSALDGLFRKFTS